MNAASRGHGRMLMWQWRRSCPAPSREEADAERSRLSRIAHELDMAAANVRNILGNVSERRAALEAEVRMRQAGH